MNKLRILITSKDLRFEGGVVNFLIILLKNLRKDMEVDHFQIGERYANRNKYKKPFLAIWDSLRLTSKCIGRHYDCIHINPSFTLTSLLRDGLFLLVLICLRYHRTVIFIHGWQINIQQKIERNRLLLFIFRAVYGRGAVVIVLGERFRKALIDMGVQPNKIRTMTTMFDGAQLNCNTPGSDRNGRSILFFGRLTRRKGVFELLEAFSLLASKYSHLQLVFAGDGPAKSEMEEWIQRHGLSRRIVFTGYVRDREKAQLLAESDYFVLPSYSEGCPVSLLEAMAVGMPIVTTAVGGVPDIFEDGRNGILIEQELVSGIERGIERFIKDEAFAKFVRDNNLKDTREKYEAKVVTKQMEEIYMEVASIK